MKMKRKKILHASIGTVMFVLTIIAFGQVTYDFYWIPIQEDTFLQKWNLTTSSNSNSNSSNSSNSSNNNGTNIIRSNNDSYAVFEGEDHVHVHDHPLFLTYKLIKGPRLYDNPVQNITYSAKRNCRVFRKSIEDRSFPELDAQYDFHTNITTNLNIVYIGDSVASQFGEILGDAVGATLFEIVRYSRNMMSIAHIVKAMGGGNVATFRVTGLFSDEQKNKRSTMAPMGGGGWLESDIHELKRFNHQWRRFQTLMNASAFVEDIDEVSYPCTNMNSSQTEVIMDHVDRFPLSGIVNSTASCTEKDFDIAIHQIAAGWMNLYKPLDVSININSIESEILFIFERFGVNTVILQTIPVLNNVKTGEELVATNKKIWSFVRLFRQQEYEQCMKQKQSVAHQSIINGFSATNTTSKNDKSSLCRSMRKILVMELGAYSTSLVLHNAIHLGAFNETSNATKAAASGLISLHSTTPKSFNYGNESFLKYANITLQSIMLQKLKTKRQNKFYPYKMAHICGELLNENQRNSSLDCSRNMFSVDGMHWCTDTTGGRLNAVAACLMQCSLKYEYDEKGEESDLVQCETECNAQFMTLSKLNWNETNDLLIQY